jgi:hypothetical protein
VRIVAPLAGELVGGIVGYFVGAFIGCDCLYPTSTRCGIHGAFLGLQRRSGGGLARLEISPGVILR